MRTRNAQDGCSIEGQCRVCSEWKLLTDGTGNLFRNPTGDESWYWNSTTRQYKNMCKSCEREYKRARAATRSTGRIFGVEMEITGPSATAVIDALVDAGIRMAPQNVRTGREIRYSATNTDTHCWTLKHDGSVHGYGLELVSPKLQGAAGMAEVETVCAALNAAGATVDRSTGLHVHHDFRQLTIDEIRTQVLAFVEREALIAELVAPSRRNHGYCGRWSPTQVRNLRAITELSQLAYVGPRGSINCQAYGVHGSIEIRFHGGSTNARKVNAWIRFGQALFAAAAAGASVSTTDAEDMLRDLLPFGLTATDAATLLRFRRVGQNRAEIEATIREAQELLEEVA